MLNRARLERGRPYLREDGYEIKSPRSPMYNCIAWAAGDSHSWWEPRAEGLDPDAGPTYWPAGAPNDYSLASYVRAFAMLGYVECEAADLEPEFEKVVLSADEAGEATHAARQLNSGLWTSKIGTWEDIEHQTPYGVEGPAYGRGAKLLASSCRQYRPDTGLRL